MENKKIDFAWVLFLNSNNYYIYMLIGVYYDLLKTKTKYPIYCVVTDSVNNNTLNILDKLKINIIKINTDKINSKLTLAEVPHYKSAFAKLGILGNDMEEKFNKICYLDTDLQIFDNIDELAEKPHMSAIADEYPYKDKTKNEFFPGCSIFCSGLFIWDFKQNKGLGQKIIDTLDKLDKTIGWHDQSVLNYWYKDWKNTPELHLSPTYGIMNDNFTIETFNKLYGTAKVIHYVSRPRDEWPFNNILYAKTNGSYKYSKWIHVVSWLKNINEAIDYFKLDLSKIKVENINFSDIPKEYIKDTFKKAADGRANCYLYF